MKKILLFVCILLLCGCSKEKVMVCTFDNVHESKDYSASIEYNVKYKGQKVTRVEITETYNSKDPSMLNYFEQYRNLYYEELNKKYGSHTIDQNYKDNKLVLSITVDYNLIDINKMIKDKYISKTYVKGNSITKNGAKLFYEKQNAVCKE